MDFWIQQRDLDTQALDFGSSFYTAETCWIWQTSIPPFAKFLSDWGGRLLHYNSFRMRKEGCHFRYVTADLSVGFLANSVRSRKLRVGHGFLPNWTVFGTHFNRQLLPPDGEKQTEFPTMWVRRLTHWAGISVGRKRFLSNLQVSFTACQWPATCDGGTLTDANIVG